MKSIRNTNIENNKKSILNMSSSFRLNYRFYINADYSLRSQKNDKLDRVYKMHNSFWIFLVEWKLWSKHINMNIFVNLVSPFFYFQATTWWSGARVTAFFQLVWPWQPATPVFCSTPALGQATTDWSWGTSNPTTQGIMSVRSQLKMTLLKWRTLWKFWVSKKVAILS